MGMRPALTARWGRMAIGAASLLIVLEGAAPLLLNRFSREEERRLGEPGLPVRHDFANAYVCDLTRLNLAPLADSTDDHERSPVILTEDGTPLRPHAMHDDIRNGRSSYSHWGTQLYFSTSDGSDPTSNGRVYTLHFRGPSFTLLGMAAPYAFIGAVWLLLVLTAVTVIAPASPAAAALIARRAILFLGAALMIMMLCQIWQERHRFAISPDSKTYVLPPAQSARPPGYFAFIAAVSDPAKAREAVFDLLDRQQVNVRLEGAKEHPLVRIVLAQNILLAVVVLLAFVGFSGCIPVPLAAAVMLMVGQFLPKIPLGAYSRIPGVALFIPAAAGALLIAPLLLQAVRAGADRRLFTIVVSLISLVVLGDVFPMALQSTLIPDEHAVVVSETLAMAAELAVVTSLVLYLTRRSMPWLWIASLMAGVAFLIRPAAVFTLVLMGAVGGISCLGRARRSWFQAGCAVACGLLVALAPILAKKVSHADAANVSMLKWALAPYALSVAQPQDAARIEDPNARELLERALVARNKARAEVVPPDHWPYDPEVYRMGDYLYRIILPISKQIAARQTTADVRTQATEWNGMMWKMALPIYRAHWPSLISMFARSYAYALGSGSRLSQVLPWWLVLIGVGVLAWIGRSPLAGAGVMLCAAHLLHLAVACTFDVPINRYIFATEFMSVIGVILIVWGCVLRLTRLSDSVAAS